MGGPSSYIHLSSLLLSEKGKKGKGRLSSYLPLSFHSFLFKEGDILGGGSFLKPHVAFIFL